MTVSELLRTSRQHVAYLGFVEIIGISGIGLALPNEKDDFCKLTDHLSEDHIFEELWVYDH
jgi:hypothetical protein